jgi:hypothetical protein
MSAVLIFISIPFRILGWVIKHPRILFGIIILIFIIFGIKACSSVFNENNTVTTESGETISMPKVQEYQTLAPKAKQAPYVISSGTRIYYVVEYSDKNNIVTLKKYYFFNKDTWQLENKPLIMDRKYYGQITINKR